MKKRCTRSPLRVKGDWSKVLLMFWDTGGGKCLRGKNNKYMNKGVDEMVEGRWGNSPSILNQHVCLFMAPEGPVSVGAWGLGELSARLSSFH